MRESLIDKVLNRPPIWVWKEEHVNVASLKLEVARLKMRNIKIFISGLIIGFLLGAALIIGKII